MIKAILSHLFGHCKSSLELSQKRGTTIAESRSILVTYSGGTLVLEV